MVLGSYSCQLHVMSGTVQSEPSRCELLYMALSCPDIGNPNASLCVNFAAVLPTLFMRSTSTILSVDLVTYDLYCTLNHLQAPGGRSAAAAVPVHRRQFSSPASLADNESTLSESSDSLPEYRYSINAAGV